MAALLHIASAAERLRIWLLSQKWFTSHLLPVLPRWLRWGLRTVYLAPIDLIDRVMGRKTGVMPPRLHNCSGAVIDFEGSGKAAIKALEEVAGLTPSSKVLDIGCGYGRLAAAMAGYLDAHGSYDGLDIIPDAIRWCEANIKNSHSNLHFQLADVYNKEYNPKGRLRADQYQLPYEDNSFDVIVLVSVFTHMVPSEFNRYVSEIARVLKPTGQCAASYALITDQSRRLMMTATSSLQFKHFMGTHWVMSKKVPELAVAFEESYVREVYAKNGLVYDFYPGYWCGQPSRWARDSGTGEQDVLVARHAST
ncbi:class I SAM-dependent methyltransferase [Methylobacterium nodulans]|uniref:Methyltransferase type 11 n=1 Tax=Methylobacterium nodulans (strain LMG 21967 / CNCM I-2342 / ORS 2060) TaxID=460265 RepID=B8IHE6_METNO|nr:class I SAM-dependent methyltransferase [Methylobacterium nodulans]ACL61609.1 Methyltransferase type 11 [Methylobacterium nodulans ORS 2060]